MFAMLPGAGHMYNGFMKLGVSFMSLFFAIAFLSVSLRIGPIMMLAPVIWFYAFFDCINRRFQDDEEFYAQQDYYLFEMEKLRSFDFGFLVRRKMIVGIGLIAFGAYILWENTIIYMLYRLDLPDYIINNIVAFSEVLPQIAFSILVIWGGLCLIKGKKSEVDREFAGASGHSGAADAAKAQNGETGVMARTDEAAGEKEDDHDEQ